MDIQFRRRRNYILADIDCVLSGVLKDSVYITPHFVATNYENFTHRDLQKDLHMVELDLFDIIESDYSKIFMVCRDENEPGFLRRSYINKMLVPRIESKTRLQLQIDSETADQEGSKLISSMADVEAQECIGSNKEAKFVAFANNAIPLSYAQIKSRDSDTRKTETEAIPLPPSNWSNEPATTLSEPSQVFVEDSARIDSHTDKEGLHIGKIGETTIPKRRLFKVKKAEGEKVYISPSQIDVLIDKNLAQLFQDVIIERNDETVSPNKRLFKAKQNESGKDTLEEAKENTSTIYNDFGIPKDFSFQKISEKGDVPEETDAFGFSRCSDKGFSNKQNCSVNIDEYLADFGLTESFAFEKDTKLTTKSEESQKKC